MEAASNNGAGDRDEDGVKDGRSVMEPFHTVIMMRQIHSTGDIVNFQLRLPISRVYQSEPHIGYQLYI